jgi:hypothetical protein
MGMGVIAAYFGLKTRLSISIIPLIGSSLFSATTISNYKYMLEQKVSDYNLNQQQIKHRKSFNRTNGTEEVFESYQDFRRRMKEETRRQK